jgi:hypothetical protein
MRPQDVISQTAQVDLRAPRGRLGDATKRPLLFHLSERMVDYLTTLAKALDNPPAANSLVERALWARFHR